MSDRRAELEAAIDAKPWERDAYEVYADELQRLGDPRGELIALQLTEVTPEREDRARVLIAAHGFEPPLEVLKWVWGFAAHAELDLLALTDRSARGVRAVLDHPSLRFLSVLDVVAVERGVQPVIDALASRPAPAIGQLRLGSMRRGGELSVEACDLGVLDALWSQLPNLYYLEIDGQNLSLGTLALPELMSLRIGSLSLRDDVVEAVLAEPWPELTSLDLDFGHANPSPALLDRVLAHPFPELNTLWLTGNFLDDLIEPLARWPGLPRITWLALLHGLTDRGGALLEKHADAFAHLDNLLLTRNYLTPPVVERLRHIARSVSLDDQREPVDRDPDLYDY